MKSLVKDDCMGLYFDVTMILIMLETRIVENCWLQHKRREYKDEYYDRIWIRHSQIWKVQLSKWIHPTDLFESQTQTITIRVFNMIWLVIKICICVILCAGRPTTPLTTKLFVWSVLSNTITCIRHIKSCILINNQIISARAALDNLVFQKHSPRQSPFSLLSFKCYLWHLYNIIICLLCVLTLLTMAMLFPISVSKPNILDVSSACVGFTSLSGRPARLCPSFMFQNGQTWLLNFALISALLGIHLLQRTRGKPLSRSSWRSEIWVLHM